MSNDTISVAIRNARQKADMTQKEVAQALDKAPTTVTAWETGRAQPDAATIVALARLFNVTSDYLLGLSRVSSEGQEEMVKEIFGDSFGEQPERNISEVSQILDEIKMSLSKLNKLSPALISDACDIIYSSASAVGTIVDCYLDIFQNDSDGEEDIINAATNIVIKNPKEYYSSVDSQSSSFSVEAVKTDLLGILRRDQLKSFSSATDAIIKNRGHTEKDLQILVEGLKVLTLENLLKDMNDIMPGAVPDSDT